MAHNVDISKAVAGTVLAPYQRKCQSCEINAGASQRQLLMLQLHIGLEYAGPRHHLFPLLFAFIAVYCVNNVTVVLMSCDVDPYLAYSVPEEPTVTCAGNITQTQSTHILVLLLFVLHHLLVTRLYD